MQLTRLLAAEFSPRGINVNAVAPGTIRTAQTAPLLQPEVPCANCALRQTPLGRFGDPTNLAWPIVFLCIRRLPISSPGKRSWGLGAGLQSARATMGS